MSITVMNAAATWWASDIPVLPSPVAMQWGLQASWSVVLAWLGAVLAARWTRGRAVPLGVAMALAVSAWLPGQASTSYWLGLAFQAPSVSALPPLRCLLRIRIAICCCPTMACSTIGWHVRWRSPCSTSAA